MTIKELRKEKKLSQAAFAARLGVATVTISQLETGRMKVSAKIAAAVKEAFDTEVDAGEREKASAKKAAAKKEAAGKTPAKESGEKKAAADKPAKTSRPVRALKPTIYIQSPYGGNITPEEVLAKLPEGTEACFVRVDQNLIWWVLRDGETGAVEIWE